ncbi:MAG: FAD-dependent oxidoreductase [Bacteroidales bacterium]|nr:FAD-dependent oxidoreductase [Bacteroidales bacterium]
MRIILSRFTLLITAIIMLAGCNRVISTDILIAGGGASGTAAGIQAARMGVSAVIIEEHEWLGGMLTSAGVSAVDGNYNLQGGIWREFRDSLSSYYGGDSLLKTGWVSNVLFEPSAGDRIFKSIVAAEPLLTVSFNSFVEKVTKRADGWKVKVKVEAPPSLKLRRTKKVPPSLKLRRTKEAEIKRVVYKTKVLIDATELGDVAALCGVPYDLGMDSRNVSGEDIAPEVENNIIQDMTFVAILKDYGHDVSIEEPDGYDPSLYNCCCINPLCEGPDGRNRLWPCESMMNYGKLPNGKYMINWPIEGNDYYLNLVEMSREEREEALKAAKNHTMGFLYFMQHELGLNTLGLADDEYPTPDRLPFIPYYRESRRIHGKVRFSMNHITHPYDQPEKLYRTTIAVGDYPVDHHHGRYSGTDSLPDLNFYPVPSYGLPMGVMIPENTDDLIVAEKSISVTNIVNGTTRLQPVVLQVGQAAGALAAIAVKEAIGVSEVSVRDVQNQLLSDGGYLLPYLDVSPDHFWFRALQKIGATGIMKGIGRSSGWSNQTFFRVTDTLYLTELNGLNEFYHSATRLTETPVTTSEAIELIRAVAVTSGTEIREEEVRGALQLIEAADAAADRIILRGEMAVLIDALLDPFNRFEVDVKGNLK